MKIDPIMATDFYKTGHIYQYPENTELVFSNETPRSDRLFKSPLKNKVNGVVVFGLQYAIKYIHELFDERFFKGDIEKIAEKYARRMNVSLGKGKVGTEHIRALHALGYLPLEIRTLEEGTICPIRVPFISIHNTLPGFYWLVNYLETIVSCTTWGMITNATIAFHYRLIAEVFGKTTGFPSELIDYQIHDFSMRGMLGLEAAAMSGAAHLTSFNGTDTIPAIDLLEDYYYKDPMSPIGVSVPATEHSVMCMGTEEGEKDTYLRLIRQYPDGILSIVSDTWDYWKVLTELAVDIKDDILARDGKLVFRPDSGDPVKILAGYKVIQFEALKEILIDDYLNHKVGFKGAEEDNVDSIKNDINDLSKLIKYDLDRARGLGFELIHFNGEYLDLSDNEIKLIPWYEVAGSVEVLHSIFGGTVNEGGFIVLDSHVGLLYGDSITLDREFEIMQRLTEKGYCSGNVVLGVGSFSYQYNTRDTFGIAIKATAGKVNGVNREIMKDPATDKDKTKKSAKGFIKVIRENDTYVMYDQVTEEQVADEDNALKLLYRNGKFEKLTDIATIRDNIRTELGKLI